MKKEKGIFDLLLNRYFSPNQYVVLIPMQICTSING